MKKLALLLSGLLVPMFAFAQPDPRAIQDVPLVRLIDFILVFIDYVLVPLVFALALIAFLWGIFNFFIAGGADEEKREKGKKFMVWGFIGFFVMVSVWGIVNLLVSSFGFDQQRPDLPTFGQQQGIGQEGSPLFPSSNVGSECEATVQCGGGLICIDGTCERPAEQGAGSSQSTNVGSSCVASIQCGGGLICIDGTCELPANQNSNSSSGGVGSSCEATVQCGGDLICIDGTCENPIRYR